MGTLTVAVVAWFITFDASIANICTYECSSCWTVETDLLTVTVDYETVSVLLHVWLHRSKMLGLLYIYIVWKLLQFIQYCIGNMNCLRWLCKLASIKRLNTTDNRWIELDILAVRDFFNQWYNWIIQVRSGLNGHGPNMTSKEATSDCCHSGVHSSKL